MKSDGRSGSVLKGVRALALWGALAGLAANAQTAPDGAVEQGRYLFDAAGCAACHTAGEEDPFLAGGRPLKTPFGTFYSPNITPDPEYGIGGWTLDQFRRALREGVGPDGIRYFPIFPYTSYTRMSDRDVTDLWAYLRTVEPVARPNRAHELPWYLVRPVAARAWQLLFFRPARFAARADRSPRWNRGAYLVEALAHCAECHTPRTPWGTLDRDRLMAGNPSGPDGERVPNITPDRESGIGKWDRDEILWYLETGGLPGGDYAGSLMAEVIDNGLRLLTAGDRQAIADYLLELRPIRHVIPGGK